MLLVAIPFTILVSFTLNILLRELGAADLSGAGAAFGAVTQIGPLVTVSSTPVCPRGIDSCPDAVNCASLR